MTCPVTIEADSDGLMRLNNKIRLPPSAADLKIKLLTISIAGNAKHPSAVATADSLCVSFTWKRSSGDTTNFVAHCLFCIMSRSSARLPHPLEPTLHPHVPEKVLQPVLPFPES